MVRSFTLALTVLLALAAFGALAGCKSGSKAATPTAGTTAKGDLKLAESALSTTAPDAKLLIVQTASVVTTDTTPVWQYLFGSPTSNKLFAVTVRDGKAESVEYGAVSMGADEWKAVPSTSEWKIDSNTAHEKALTVYKNGTPTTAYLMGMVTYVPKSATTATNRPMVWDVTFDPASRGDAPTSTINVSATTGEVVTK
jgi:hypothetical protein